MKHITKYGASLVALGLLLSFPAGPALAFQSVTKVLSTAQATLSGAGSITLSNVLIKKIADNSADTAINWTGVSLSALPSHGWVAASSYIQFDAVASRAGSGIQTYTDNTNASAIPRFTGDPAQHTPAGLVNQDAPTLAPLSMAWAVKGTLPATPPVSAEPNDYLTDPNAYQWHYYSDAGQVAIPTNVPPTPAFQNALTYNIVKQANGIHTGGGDGEFNGAPLTNFMYLQANFNTAQTPATYKTSHMILEAFQQ